MIVQEIYLLKTPLDDSYKNVLDFNFDVNSETNYSPRELLYLMMVENFENINVKVPNRGIKKSIDLTSITIPKEYIEVRDYNYCIIVTDYKNQEHIPLFYFVNNIVSENDGNNTPSCTLTLKWDAWSNNVNDLTNNIAINDVEQAHYDRIDAIDGFNLTPRFYPMDIPKVPATLTECTFDGRYAPLFLRIILRNDWTSYKLIDEIWQEVLYRLPIDITKVIKNPIDTSEQYTATLGYVYDSLGGNGVLPVLYCLAGIYDIQKGDFVDSYKIVPFEGFVNIGYLKNNVTQQYEIRERPNSEYLVERKLYNDIPSEMYDLIETVEYTYYCPLEYNINPNYAVPHFSIKAYVSLGASSKLQFISGCGEFLVHDIFSEQDDKLFNYYKPITPHNIEIQPFNNREFIYPTEFSKLSKSLYRLFDNDNNPRIEPRILVETEPKFYDYPFNYLSINTLYDEYLPMRVGYIDNDYTLSINCQTRTPLLYVYENIDGANRKVLTPSAIVLQNSGIFSRAENVLAAYMNRNAETIQMGKMMNTLGRVLSIANQGVKSSVTKSKSGKFGIISTAMEEGFGIIKHLTMLDANLADLSNTPDKITVKTGECEAFYQDRVRVVKHSCHYNSPYVLDALKLMYIYGYNYNSTFNILENNRFYFDFVKTSNCSLHSININYADRRELEDMFDRGVHKWHINLDIRSGTDKVIFPQTFIPSHTTTLNVEKKFYYDDDYYTWVNPQEGNE